MYIFFYFSAIGISSGTNIDKKDLVTDMDIEREMEK